jgi:hypothetical protein
MKHHIAILKTVKTYQGKVIWEALYINGEKILENQFLVEDAIKNAFKLDKIIKLPIFERFSENYMRFFPKFEDFSFLDKSLKPLSPGDKVYLDEYLDDQYMITPGYVIVKDIFSEPNTNLIWEKSLKIDDNSIWFTCLQIPGVFYWNRLQTIQKELESLYNNIVADLKDQSGL